MQRGPGMKRQTAIIISEPGGPEVLRSATVPLPEPGPGQVLIRIAAAGVNRHDCNQRRAGRHSDGNPVPGLECAGVVEAVGDAVHGVAVGEAVAALVQGGGYGEFAVADAGLVLPVPEGVSLTEAAGLPEALFTTWWNFFFLMQLRPDDYALIHGGTSGVGHIALQAMSALGYRVIATAGAAEKVAAARSFGALAAYSYHDADLAAKVMEATGGAGISALLDMSAGAHLEDDLAMMAPDGRIAHLSGGDGARIAVPLQPLMARRISITGSLLRPLEVARKRAVAEALRREVWPLVGDAVRPHVAHVLPLSEAAEAHRIMERGGHIGKVILSVAP